MRRLWTFAIAGRRRAIRVWSGFTATLYATGTHTVIENFGGGQALFYCTGSYAVS